MSMMNVGPGGVVEVGEGVERGLVDIVHAGW